jgi:catechol 2,3-dioxygenase-like lactoylglutathione lyase family enzyme
VQHRPMETLRIELFVDNLDRFVEFYVDVLRFELVDDRRADPSPYAAVERGSVRIGAVPAWEPVDRTLRSAPHGTELVITVDDLAAERDAVVAAGWPLAVDITERPWGLTDFRLHDLDGYYLRFSTREVR